MQRWSQRPSDNDIAHCAAMIESYLGMRTLRRLVLKPGPPSRRPQFLQSSRWQNYLVTAPCDINRTPTTPLTSSITIDYHEQVLDCVNNTVIIVRCRRGRGTATVWKTRPRSSCIVDRRALVEAMVQNCFACPMTGWSPPQDQFLRRERALPNW
jgi:hypothetical protein